MGDKRYIKMQDLPPEDFNDVYSYIVAERKKMGKSLLTKKEVIDIAYKFGSIDVSKRLEFLKVIN